MPLRARVVTGLIALAILSPQVAHAQRAGENPVASADDAFGSSVGLESTGIYSDRDTRGFSPIDAGNARIDGVYYDPVGNLSGRLRQGTAIRVGFTAEDYPFNAPTGIADYRFRGFPDILGLSASYYLAPYGGDITDTDLRLPVIPGKLGITGGIAHASLPQTDGSRNTSYGVALRPILRLDGLEFAPFVSWAEFYTEYTRPLAVVSAAQLPKLPKKRRYLGEDWAQGHQTALHLGGTLKAAISPALSVRAGLFRSAAPRQSRFTEIFVMQGTTPLATHLLYADPRQDLHSTSGEALVSLKLGGGRWSHRLIAGFRARDRHSESGGSDIRNFGTERYGDKDPEDRPVFRFGPVNQGRVRQSSVMLGYLGRIEGLGHINLGIQKARYTGRQRDGRSGLVTTSRDAPWLYNAVLTWDVTSVVSAYAGTESGLEDSGVAPESALNRAEQLSATRTRQFEGGLRWKIGKMQAVVSAFEITKAYFSYDAQRRFVRLGTVRHRGVEGSVSGRLGKRLSLVAGAVAMQPRVSGPGVDARVLGRRPTGTPDIHVKLDANYRTDLLNGITATASVNYVSRRAVTSAPVVGGTRQLMLKGTATVDLGFREQFEIGSTPASVRVLLLNAFDAKAWKVAAANTLYPDERRRFSLTVTADF